MDKMQPVMTIDEFGNKFWRVDGALHRTDGPALERTNGDYGWYLNDVYLTFDQWLEANTEISDEEKVMMKLQYG